MKRLVSLHAGEDLITNRGKILRLVACGREHRLIRVTADNLSNNTKIIAVEGRAQRGEHAYEKLMAWILVKEAPDIL